MRVYAVCANDYEDNGTRAVFAERETAQEFADALNGENSYAGYTVEEFEVMTEAPKWVTHAWANWRSRTGKKADGTSPWWDNESPAPVDGSAAVMHADERAIMVWATTPEVARAARDAEMARIGVA